MMPDDKPARLILKDERRSLNIPGIKNILLKNQSLISCGISSLDCIIGGGIQVGSIFLIEEDEFGVFSTYLTKYFLAEGLACNHCLLTCSLDQNVRDLVYELPSPVDYLETQEDVKSTDGLKIAWRYQNAPVVQSVPSTVRSTTSFGHSFDLTRLYPKEAIDNAEVSYWPCTWPLDEDCEDPYTSLLGELHERVQKQGHSTCAAVPRRTVLRVAIHGLGSLLWPDPHTHLLRFFYCLRQILHRAYASAVITLSASLLEPALVEQCEHLSDNVVRLESLANNPSPVYNEYNGLLSVVKLATLNTLASHVPDTLDWGFKLRKKRFVVEKLHLPPELQDSTQREQDDSSVLTCASSKAAVLDF